jgi:chromosome partitioning protein
VVIAITSVKGGVGKTTTAIHLAAYLSRFAPTLLIDGDAIRASTRWSQRGNGGKPLPFQVVDETQTARYARQYVDGHIVIDTEANPSNVDFRQVADGCDLLVIPAVPETTATDGLIYTLSMLQDIGNDRYRVLLTKVPPRPRMDGVYLREMLVKLNVPVFAAEIPQLVAFDRASEQGVPVYDVKDERAARAWEGYEEAGKEIFNGQKQVRRPRKNHPKK